MRFTEPGEAETTKAAVHGALFTLVGLCCVYNACAWCARRDRHLAVNAVVYAGAAVYEIAQIVRHHGQGKRCERPY